MEQSRLKGILPFPSIRAQLLIVSLVVLILPWIGVQTLREMEHLLRQQQVQSVTASAKSMLNALVANENTILAHNEAAALSPAGSEIILSDFTSRITVDGYSDDWPAARIKQEYNANNALQDGNPDSELSFTLSSVQQRGKLLLLLDVNDDRLHQTANAVTEPHDGDRLLLGFADEQARINRRYIINSNAPGWLRVTPLHDPGRYETRIRAELQVRTGGYTIEISIPDYLLSRHIAIQLIDRDNNDNSDYAVIGNTPIAPATGGLLFGKNPQLTHTIKTFGTAEQAVSVIDRRGYVLASTRQLESAESAAPADEHIIDRLLRILMLADAIVGEHEPMTYHLQQPHVQSALNNQSDARYYRDTTGHGFLSVAVPLVITDKLSGAVVIQQSTDAISSVRYRALVKIMLTSLSAIAAIAIILLLYATILIKRIRKLNRNLHYIASNDGRLQQDLDPSIIGDEIGELNRGIAGLLARLHAYQQYLETMASKLSHELRTPLSVVRSSLESLQLNNHELTEDPLIGRANNGLDRLQTILANLTEASRLESALQTTELEQFDLCRVVEGCIWGYRQIYPEVIFVLDNAIGEYPLNGSAELIAQMMDKLVNNAVDFHVQETPIKISLLPAARSDCHLCVQNEGQTIEQEILDTLFDSMVSARTGSDDTPHMGLGLYIVRLIAHFHHGQASINSKDGLTSVCVTFGQRQL